MKVFERSSTEGWGNRMNFVDNNNVVVGFDYSSQCCEQYYWYASYEEAIKATDIRVKDEWDEGHQSLSTLPNIHMDSEFLYFDTSYNKSFVAGDLNSVQLKIKGGEKDIYLVLVNSHNGYYSHGFDLVDDKGNVILEGNL